ncbi:MAG: DUF2793 domain-containing protein [Sphingopyxis sp.]|nr:DUF2793 domain-containing protein [Sphingopyxis sp.]
MVDTVTTPRHALPLLAAGQAQKEVTHNEALRLVDALIAPVVVAIAVDMPPANPAIGQCWAVGEAPTGLWTGQARRLAIASDGGWRFAAMPLGATVKIAATGELATLRGTGWARAPLLAPPSGGTTVDTECRAALSNLINAIADAGLIRQT